MAFNDEEPFTFDWNCPPSPEPANPFLYTLAVNIDNTHELHEPELNFAMYEGLADPTRINNIDFLQTKPKALNEQEYIIVRNFLNVNNNPTRFEVHQLWQMYQNHFERDKERLWTWFRNHIYKMTAEGREKHRMYHREYYNMRVAAMTEKEYKDYLDKKRPIKRSYKERERVRKAKGLKK